MKKQSRWTDSSGALFKLAPYATDRFAKFGKSVSDINSSGGAATVIEHCCAGDVAFHTHLSLQPLSGITDMPLASTAPSSVGPSALI
jgi:hypothetical protein